MHLSSRGMRNTRMSTFGCNKHFVTEGHLEILVLALVFGFTIMLAREDLLQLPLADNKRREKGFKGRLHQTMSVSYINNGPKVARTEHREYKRATL